jgi:hypothetical protein
MKADSTRRIEYGIVPLDRQTAQPIALGDEGIESCLVADINALHEIMDKVNPAAGMQCFVPDEKFRDGMIGSFARMLAEMFGADIYYRHEGSDGAWTLQKGYLPGGRRVAP